MSYPMSFGIDGSSASGFWGDFLIVMNQYHECGRSLQHWVVTLVWSTKLAKNLQCVVDDFGDLITV